MTSFPTVKEGKNVATNLLKFLLAIETVAVECTLSSWQMVAENNYSCCIIVVTFQVKGNFFVFYNFLPETCFLN